MRDRIPEPGKANRIRITLDNGNVVEGVLGYADNAQQAGSVYSKGNVLPDVVCSALGLDTDAAEPKDAFWTLAALAASGGSGDAGGLEDTDVESGVITNSGAGWNSFSFQAPFETVPQVLCQPIGFDGIVQVQNVTKTGFQYCLRTQASGTYYVGASTGTSPSHSAATLVSGTTTTAEAVKIHYIAIENGGER